MDQVFFFLSKTVFVLGMPITWVFILIFWALITKRNQLKRGLLAFTLIFLYSLSCPALSNLFAQWWEYPVTPIADLEKHDVAIVLTGITSSKKKPFDRIYTSQGADRILHAGLLYQRGKVDHILITGGAHESQWHNTRIEAEELREILYQMGIPDSVITLERKAINTHKNAEYAAEILRKDFAGQKYILITSAFHMPRSIGCFAKQEIEVTPFSTDFKTDGYIMHNFMGLVPTEGALSKSSVIIHEIVGYIVYDLVGYI